MTAQDIFNITVDLISERLDSGLIDTTNTINYTKRTPGLLTLIQGELCKIVPLTKTQPITASLDSGYQKLDLPADYLSIHQIVDEDLEPTTSYKIIGDDIYVPFNFTGTLVYRYIPETITVLSDTIPFGKEIGNTVMAYGLAAHLLINENTSLASYFNERYNELLMKIKTKQPATISKIKDVYDASCRF